MAQGRRSNRRELKRLRRRVRAIEEALGLWESDGTVRVGRLAVVDDVGVERVVLSADSRTGSVIVRLDRPAGGTTGVELYAGEDPDTGDAVYGLAMLSEGSPVVRMDGT